MEPAIPDPLPVGVSRSVQYNSRNQRLRNLPEDRHHAFSAHIGIQGKSYAKHFWIARLGEEQAFQMALAWRKTMEASVGKLSKWQGKVGVPGKRRPNQKRPSSKKSPQPVRKRPKRLSEIIDEILNPKRTRR